MWGWKYRREYLLINHNLKWEKWIQKCGWKDFIVMEKRHLSFRGRRGIREAEMEVSLMMTIAEIICWSWKAPNWFEDWEIERIVNNFEGFVQVQYKLWGWFKIGNVEGGGLRILGIWVCWLERRLNSIPGWNCHQETSLSGTKGKAL